MHRYVRRLTALAATLCLVAAPAAQASKQTSLAVNVTVGAGSATFNIQTNQTAATVLNVGTTKQYGLTFDLGTKSKLTVTGLAPGTTYYYSATARSAESKPATFTQSFSTQNVDAAGATISSKNGMLLLNGVPTMPIMMWDDYCPTASDVSMAQSLHAIALETDWTVATSPCDPAMIHAALQNQIGLFDASNPGPIDGLPELMRLQGTINKPDFPSISPVLAGPAVAPSKTPATPQYAHADFWDAFISGASGVYYFANDHGSADGSVPNTIQIEPGIPAQAASDAGILATLQPALLYGQKLSIQLIGKNVIAIAKSYNGAIYVIAQNISSPGKSVTGTLRLKGVTQGAVQVLWENRKLVLNHGEITDEYAPNAVHFYRITTTPKK